MDDYFLLLLLSFAMFLGSYISGSLPLVVSFSESKLRLVTIVGAGLLVGTALAVIIPEGVQSIYTAHMDELVHFHKFPPIDQHMHPVVDIPADARAHPTPAKLTGTPHKRGLGDININLLAKKEEIHRMQRQLVETSVQRTKRNVELGNKPDLSPLPSESMKNYDEKHSDEFGGAPHKHEEGGGPTDVHHAVGLALVAGFVLMLLVDQLAQSRMSRIDAASGVVLQQPRYKITATIGLVVHAAADGVALGAASGSAHNDVQFIVFVAIMLHKAPASFGLVTFLLHEGLDKSKIRRHLLIFSLAAPLAALATFLFVTKGGPESLTSLHSTGVLLLFSAGTFLYVATVHVLPEIASGGHAHGNQMAGGSGASGLKLNELFALVMGAVLPTLLTVGHSH